MLNKHSFEAQSLLFAECSAIAYKNQLTAEPLFRTLGATNVTFISKKGTECYVIEDNTDMIIVCRGTEPKQWADIAADLSIDRVAPVVGVGKVHVGFQHYVNHIWSQVAFHVMRSVVQDKTLWFTGHSLGAAMATLMARASVPLRSGKPILFTYGSPRVGNRAYINDLNQKVTHHRWVNHGDAVTKVPLVPFFYHSGTRHHLSVKGEARSKWELVVRLTIGFISTLIAKIVGDLKDHSISMYIKHLEVKS